MNTSANPSHTKSAFAELVTIILPTEAGRKVKRYAREAGLFSSTAIRGKGTVRGLLADLFMLDEQRKEIILLLCAAGKGRPGMHHIAEQMQLDKPGHGIAYLTRVEGAVGLHHEDPDAVEATTITEHHDDTKAKEHSMTADTYEQSNTDYQALFTIVDQGMADDVMDAALDAGAKGGTVLHGRGSGKDRVEKIFAMEIEPEKDIILILTRREDTQTLIDAINAKLELDKPGRGILFVQDVVDAVGLAT